MKPVRAPQKPRGIGGRLALLQKAAEVRGPVQSREEEFLENGGDPEALRMWGDADEIARLGYDDESEFQKPRLNAHALATRFPKVPEVVFSKAPGERALLARGASGVDCETFLIQPGRVTPRLVVTGYQASDGRQRIVGGDPHDPTVHARAFLAFTDAVVNEYLLYNIDGRSDMRGMLVNQNFAFDACVIAESAHQADVQLGLVGKPESWFEAVMSRIFEMFDLRCVEDPMLRERLIDLAEGTLGKDFASLTDKGNPRKKSYKLSTLAKNYLGVELDKLSWRYGYHRYLNVPVEKYNEGAKKYVVDDVESPLQVTTQQQARAEANGLARGSRIPNSAEQAAASFALNLVSSWGLRCSLEKVQALDAELDHWQRKLEYVLKSSGLIRKDGRNAGSRDMKRLHGLVREYYEAEGLDVPLTKSGKNISTAGAVLEDIALIRLRGSSKDELLPDGTIDEKELMNEPLYAYSQYASVQKLQSTYLPVLYAGAGRPINTRFETILETGRISSYQPNLNNLPRGGLKTVLLRLQAKVRQCFVPRPGFVFCSVDWNAMELVTLAQVCLWFFGQSKLADALNAGIDPHLLFAAEQFLHISYEEALLRKKEPNIKDMRQLAKIANFGLPGGASWRALMDIAKASYNVYLTEDESRNTKAKWLAQWPEMTPYFAMINSLLRGGVDDEGNAVGDIESFVSGMIRGRVRYTAAANHFFQALGATAFKNTLYSLQKECYLQRGSLYGSRVVGCFYDESFLEHPEETASERAWIQRDISISKFQEVVPDVKVGADPALMRCWMKEAEAAYNKSGRLIPHDEPGERFDIKGKLLA